ncbi:LLM class flavin-dependent oxidoreductase [Rhodococcus sp. G-MC3]|uniref:LLM class flavin-dependent oxidoreductase n=1 Tax=Rhodococcus sp. G-MC3 TaxID=3046209 RepID=UPI0024B9EF62|nr:LLM class flavin-dependent oxidoreductase [Rhodococcus sp. G-MC3]MDJ0393648.1 LLM class flavin-dependent oxidoreductase [Rhodococcus sp. G-MC3]
MTQIGVVLRPELPPETIVSAAREADKAGVEELWLWEDCFFSGGIATAAAVLAATDRVRVGIGVLPTPLRNVAATAMEIATLARVHPGRIRVGLGHGVQDWMAQIGARVASPMTLLREQMAALTTLLDGGTVDVEGRYVTLKNVKLDWPPLQPPPLLIGATGPKTLALSGETSSGTILTSETSPEQLKTARGHIDGGPDHDIVVYVDSSTEAATATGNLQRWVDAGATTIVLQPSADQTDFAAQFARAVELQSDFC